MKTKEERWMEKRVGMITASELSSITSASGKIIDGVISYIRSKRFERNHGYSLPVSSWAMVVGLETEPMIFEWLKEHRFDVGVPGEYIYSKDLEEIPFWIAPDTNLGASPDAYTEDEKTIFEFKTLVGNENTEFFCDPDTSYMEKKMRVAKEHLDQILGLLISNPVAERVVLIKYAPQRDDILEDTDSPLDFWRGSVFTFTRSDYEASINEMKERIRLIDAMIDSGINPSEFKAGKWSVVDGKLLKMAEEEKKSKK